MKVTVSKILSALGIAFGVAAFFVYLFGSAIYIPKKIADNELDVSGIGLFYVINFENEDITAEFDLDILNLVELGDEAAEDSEYSDIIREFVNLQEEFMKVCGSVDTSSDLKIKMEVAFVDDELLERCNAFIERCEDEGLSQYLTVTVSDLKLKTDWSVSLPVICLIISVIIGGIMTFLDDGIKFRAPILAAGFAILGGIMMPVTALATAAEASKMIASLSAKNIALADQYFVLGTGAILGCVLALISAVLFNVILIIKLIKLIKQKKQKK